MIEMKNVLKYTAGFISVLVIGTHFIFFNSSSGIISIKPTAHVFVDSEKCLVAVKPADERSIRRAILNNESGQIAGLLTWDLMKKESERL